jgi:hypothetical protein
MFVYEKEMAAGREDESGRSHLKQWCPLSSTRPEETKISFCRTVDGVRNRNGHHLSNEDLFTSCSLTSEQKLGATQKMGQLPTFCLIIGP